MLAEIIIYVALFALLFSGSFGAVFQSIDALHYLEQKKDMLDARSFLAARLDNWLQASSDWSVLPEHKLQFTKNNNSKNSYVLSLEDGILTLKCMDCADLFEQQISGTVINISAFLPQIVEIATSSVKVLNVSLDIGDISYIFSYYDEK